MTFSKEEQTVMLTAVRARTHGGATPAQVALAHAVTHGESNVEILVRLIDDVRG